MRIRVTRRSFALACLLGIGLSPIAAALPAGASNSKVIAFNGFAREMRRDLALCTAGAADTQIELGQIIASKTATNAEAVQLDTSSKQAQTACDDAKDDALANMAGISVPGALGSYKALGNVADDAEIWATDDTTAVLHDIQNIAESSGSAVALESKFQTDVTQADVDASAVNSAMKQVARKLKIKSYDGLGLIKWGS